MSKKVQTKISKFFIMLSIAFLLAALTVPAIETFAESYDCDVNGDGVAGLAEAIYILQLLTEPTEPTFLCENGNIDDLKFVSISGLCITEKTSADEYKRADVKDIIDALNDTESKTGTYRLPYESETDTKEWYQDNDGIYDTDGCSPFNMSICSSNFRVVWVPKDGETVKYTLTVSKDGSGSGTVSSDPGGISCGSDCQGDYDKSSTVTLRANADEGSIFDRWTGCDGTGDNVCTVTMDQPLRNVTASFKDDTILNAPTNVKATGGDGKVTVSWNAVEGAASYHIYWNTTGNVEKTDTSIGVASTSSKHDHNVSTTDTYYYRVCAVDSNGNDGVMSDEDSATPTTGDSGANCDNNSLGMAFKLIPAGTFKMGSPADEPGRDDDETQYDVAITEAFCMQTTEVTQEQWKSVMGDDYVFYFPGCDNCPAENVSWNDVQDFIAKLNEMGEGEYRLPTEEQWEYACRAGTTTPFYFGECLSTDQANYNGDYPPNYPPEKCTEGIDRGETVQVASFPPNDYDLYDMHGNVMEWCEDQYSENDPNSRVVRGGSFRFDASYSRSANRIELSANSRYRDTGFRLVRIPDEPAPPKEPIIETTPDDKQFTASWDSENGVSYYLYVSDKSNIDTNVDKNNCSIIVCGDEVTSQHTVSDLTNDETYYLVLEAVNELGKTKSTEVSVIPGERSVTLSAPRNIWTVADNGKVTISWNETEGADSYKLYWKKATEGVTSSNNPTFIENGTSHLHTGLTNGTTYYYRVKAKSSTGESPLSIETWGLPAAMPTEITNSLGMTFRLIPAGTFMMGSPEEEEGHEADETLHKVTITKPFYMQTTEVTQEQWMKVIDFNLSWFNLYGDKRPVESVSWENTNIFITALNQMGVGTYRLPTEAEWEYAARAGSSAAFSNGEAILIYDGETVPACCEQKQNMMGWYCGNSYKKTESAKLKSPNTWGLYDMFGNVWEWCQDSYSEDYYEISPELDPGGPSSGSYRVLRGGSFETCASECRSANRYSDWYKSGYYSVGFRLVREP